MFLAQWPKRSDAGEARNPRPLGLESSTLRLGHYAPLQGVGTGSARVKHPQMVTMSLCVSIAFLCVSVCLSFCLSACLSVCISLYMYLSVCLSVSTSITLNICGVVPADFGSRARYRAFQVFCWDSKSRSGEAHYHGTKLCIIYP